jgi:predicted transcriptional regulator
VEITRVRGLSLDILALLQSRGGLYTPEIAEELGKSRNYVRTYMHNLLQYGCVNRFGRWGWEITALGSDILLYNNNKIDKRSIKEEQKKHKRSIKETSRNSHTTHISRQLNLSLYSEDPDVTEPERVVVLALAEHYERTGEKYRYYADMYDFCDQMGITSIGIGEVMAKLKQEGVIYIRKETMFEGISLKVGLKKDFVERLQYC